MAKPPYSEGSGPIVQLLCKKRCGRMVRARVVKEPNILVDSDPNAKWPGVVAYCLECGGQALDSYNWIRS